MGVSGDLRLRGIIYIPGMIPGPLRLLLLLCTFVLDQEMQVNSVHPKFHSNKLQNAPKHYIKVQRAGATLQLLVLISIRSGLSCASSSIKAICHRGIFLIQK